MSLSTEEQMLVEQRVSNDAKSTGAAYLLWFFLGGVGAHRLYLGKIGSGLIMAVISILGWLTMGFFFLIVWFIWWVVDLFLIPKIVSQQKNKVRDKFGSELALKAKA